MNLFQALQKLNADATNEMNRVEGPGTAFPSTSKPAHIFEDMQSNSVGLVIGDKIVYVYADGRTSMLDWKNGGITKLDA